MSLLLLGAIVALILCAEFPELTRGFNAVWGAVKAYCVKVWEDRQR